MCREELTLAVCRCRIREDHLAYLRSSQRVVTAGPLFSLDDEDGDPIGSLVIFNAESEEVRLGPRSVHGMKHTRCRRTTSFVLCMRHGTPIVDIPR